ncbi:hypothetical protein GCM10023187_38200 [Nibrella viscosa]|uniref:PIN domain-containing protein n=1 Tax=Nibrella viscosa TaxID=1084524 RepID=A0ABP8KPP2_9BACT
MRPIPYFKRLIITRQLIDEDPDDNKFVDVAIAAGADYLVTNDSDFNTLKKLAFPRLTVISLQEFLNILKSEAGK